MDKHVPNILYGLALTIVIGLITFTVLTPNETVTTPAPPPPPSAVLCELECMISERTTLIHERDQADYQRQSRLKALIEIQDELHAITLNLNE